MPAFPLETAMTRFFLVLGLLCSVAHAADRVTVEIPTEDERQVESLLESMKEAVDSENAKTYLACLTKALAAKQKKDVVLRFMQHDMEMEIEKSEILEISESGVEFIAKYTLYQDGRPTRIVSSVKAKREGGMLRVSKENVLAASGGWKEEPLADNSGADLGQVAVAPCADGRCPLPPKGALKDGGRVFPEGISMFNDEHGNPDPNGIMWIPPGKIFALYPDKYGVPPCMRAKLAEQFKQ